MNEQKSGDLDTLPVNNKKSGNADQADLDGLHGLFHVWELSVSGDMRLVRAPAFLFFVVAAPERLQKVRERIE